jgi:hypothetical protein
VWKRTVQGRILTFHLAGINNQNFLMRDEETGSFWQQVSGMCIYGPLRGQALELMPSEELSFDLWRQESPGGRVLAPDPKFSARYETADWESKVQMLPTVVPSTPAALPSREVVLGIELNGTAKAYPFSTLQKETLALDRLASTPLFLAVGPDQKSVRAFVRRIPGDEREPEFYKMDGQQWAMMDSATSSLWDFRGCAVSGAARGKCLERLPILKDYWFDWHQYHPDSAIFRH